jgi:hypothetical protein
MDVDSPKNRTELLLIFEFTVMFQYPKTSQFGCPKLVEKPVSQFTGKQYVLGAIGRPNCKMAMIYVL